MGSNKIAETILPGSKKGMPVIGFGTAEYPFGASSAEIMNDCILHAIKLGYRHFDTASVYQSEPPLGDALSNALNLNLIDSRDELFVTSKLWISDAHPDRVLPALQETLRNLKLEYVDLYLVHWPLSMKPGKIELEVDKDDLLPLDYKSVWEAMEECQRLGLAKSIGVSNFSPEKLDILLANAKITPAVNQVEMNPVWQQKKLRDYCKEKGIHISAYSPLGAKGTAWGSNLVMDSDVLKQIASAKGKSVAQVCIRWIYQQGASAIVKSFNKERMKENMEIFDWELSPQDLEKISQIPQRKAHSGHDLVSEHGPYTTFQELWDEDIYPA